jgi:carboxyl-terminal processing protease
MVGSNARVRLWLHGIAFVALVGGTLPARAAETFPKGKATFEETWKLLRERYHQRGLDDEALWRAATAGLLSQVEPKMAEWNVLLTPTEYEELKSDLAGKISGVGLVMEYREQTGTADVIEVIPGTAAEGAGMKAGDRILKVEGKTYKGRSFSDLVHDIRGEAGTKVRMTLLRDAEVLDVSLKRGQVEWDTVSDTMLPSGVGVIVVRAFVDNTPSRLKESLARLTKAGAKGVVIDLRDNAGGSFERGVEAISLLLPSGATVARVRGRDGREEVVKAKGELAGTLPIGLPTAVLVDSGTACGAELAAAALRDSRGAVLVGAATKGKWSIQTVEQLENGWAAKLTVKLLAPAGGGEGAFAEAAPLAPQIAVEMPEGKKVEVLRRMKDASKRVAGDAQLAAAVAVVAR